MSKWFKNYTGDYLGTYVLSGLTIIYFSAAASLFLSGCKLYQNNSEQRPIPVKSIPIRERNKSNLI